MKNILKNKKRIILAIALLGMIFYSQAYFSKVSAEIKPILVSVDEIDFGVSFPGEMRQGFFEVEYASGDEDNQVEYRVDKRIMPKQGAEVPENYNSSLDDYCLENSEDSERCHRDLCSLLDESIEDEEDDTFNQAYVSEEDTKDNWVLDFQVPAILGNVAQNHRGAIVDETGEYACKLVFLTEEEGAYCGDGEVNQTSEDCDGGEYCDSDCKKIPYCGDGSCSGDENCGNCSADCGGCGGGGGGGGGGIIRIYGDPEPVCGNDVLEDEEECDDGNNFNGDGCNSVCERETEVLGEIGEPILTIDKTIDIAFANPGDKNIKYELKIENIGDLTAYDLIVEDNLPLGLTFSGSASSSKTWTFEKLSENEEINLEYFVDVDKNAETGTYVNVASVRALNHNMVEDEVELEIRKVEVLAKTGFDTKEFIILTSTMMSLVFAAGFLRRKISL